MGLWARKGCQCSCKGSIGFNLDNPGSPPPGYGINIYILNAISLPYVPMKLDKPTRHCGFLPFVAVAATVSTLGCCIGITWRNSLTMIRVVSTQNQ